MSTTQSSADETRQPDGGRSVAAPRGWRAALPTMMVVMLLIAEGVLLLANHWNWFSLRDYKGCGVLLAVASVLVTVAILGLWWAASLLFRRRFSFSLRCLLLLILAVAVPSAWLASALRQARHQQALREHGCDLYSGWLNVRSSAFNLPRNYKPPILVRWLGDDFFDVVNFADIDASSQFADAEMELLATQTQLNSLALNLTLNERMPPDYEVLGMHLSMFPQLDGSLSISEMRRLPEISDAGLVHIGKLRQLQSLQLFRSRLVTDAGLQPLSNLTQLETLHISDLQNVGDDGLAHIAGLRQLRRLTLLDNDITSAGLRHLSRLDQLASLNLRGRQFSDAGIQHLGRLTSLQSLSVSNTSLGDAAMEQIGKLTNLRILDLDETLITDAGCKHLTNLVNLKSLSLQGTQVTDAGLEHIKTLMYLNSVVLHPPR